MLYAPGAVVLNSLDKRSSGRHLFSGADEWLFTAVLVSFLTTGLLGFVLAEVGSLLLVADSGSYSSYSAL